MRFPRLLLAVFPFLLAGLLDGLAVPPPPRGQQAATRPSVIPQVRTWEELLDQPPLDLGDGVTVRLGIEATRCPVGSGVLVYAYAEGFDNSQVRVVNADRVGPVWVSVEPPGTSPDAKDTRVVLFDGRNGRWKTPKEDKRPRLFARVLPVDRPGAYRVAAGDDRGNSLATAVVTGTEEPFHAWSPLLLVEEAKHEGGRRASPAKATYLARGIALPYMDPAWGLHTGGWRGPPWEETDRADETPFGHGPLPKPVPERPDPGLKLTIDSGKRLLLRVTAKGPIITSRPDDHFLCRWWVNGKPAYPVPGEPLRILQDNPLLQALEMRAGGRRDRDVLIWLKLFPSRLGARSGDRVELQLLYCPSGWMPMRNPPETEAVGSPGFPRLTNRAAFMVP